MLEQLEIEVPDSRISVELTSLEQAYLKIVERTELFSLPRYSERTRETGIESSFEESLVDKKSTQYLKLQSSDYDYLNEMKSESEERNIQDYLNT